MKIVGMDFGKHEKFGQTATARGVVCRLMRFALCNLGDHAR
jgi:hypothetical protein